MTTYSPAQVAVIAKGAGFTGDGLVRAVAVALAESGGNPQAVNQNTDRQRSIDRGLWQINSYWHPEVSVAEAFNPAANAKHAYRISSGGTNWSQWATHKNGAADAQMARATMAARQATGGQAGLNIQPTFGIPGFDLPGWANPFDGDTIPGVDVPDLAGVAEALTGIGKAVAGIASLAVKASVWLSNWRNWLRVAQVVGGGAALLIGLRMLANSNLGGPVGTAARKTNSAVKKTTNAATMAVPYARAAKVAGGAVKAARGAQKARAASGAAKAGQAAKGGATAARDTAKSAAGATAKPAAA